MGKNRKENMSKKRKIFLCRHGLTKGNLIKDLKLLESEKLSSIGIQQAKSLAENFSLVKPKPEVIFSSPLLRAKQTATIIAKSLQIPVIIENRLKEYNFGIFKGEIIANTEIYKHLSTKKDRFFFRLENGESDADVVNRIQDFITNLQKQNVIVVTHDYPAFVCRKLLEGTTVDEMIDIPFQSINHGEIITINYE